MIRYSPFLKTKRNEIIALGSVPEEAISAICPLFDIHRKTEAIYTTEEFKKVIKSIVAGFHKHLGSYEEIYVDNFDIQDDLTIDGIHNYHFILESLSDLPIIPVMSIDRSDQHIDAIAALKSSGVVRSNVVACRLTVEDFENFDAIHEEIVDALDDVFQLFSEIDLILDCRVCRNFNTNDIATKIREFTSHFQEVFPTRRVVVTGSSIPASISDLTGVDTTIIIDRKEVEIFRLVVVDNEETTFVFGDYATVSPNYSDTDLPVEMLQSVMTAKLIYSYADKHFIIRGGGLKTRGASQYFSMAGTICGQSFFRGQAFSSGDLYLTQKAASQGSNCAPHAVIKPAIISHVTYVASLTTI